MARNFGVPDELANGVVFTDVMGEVIDTSGSIGVLGEDGVERGVGRLIEVGFAEHVALSDYAGGDANTVDGAVEFGVSSGHEHLVQPAAGLVPEFLEEAGIFGKCTMVHKSLVLSLKRLISTAIVDRVDDDGQLMDEFVRMCGAIAPSVAHELVNHSSQSAASGPDVAVDNPYHLATRFAVCPADVPDLGVGPQVVGIL